MTEAEMLRQVKIGLFGTADGEWRDAMLMVYIKEIEAFMIDAGVPKDKILSEATVGCFLMGVNDLWNYQSGGAKFSQYFERRVIQLASGNRGGAS